MLADRRLLLKVITIAPICAAAFGFLAATFFHWNSLKKSDKIALPKPPVVEPSPKPSSKLNLIKPLPLKYQGKVFEKVNVPPSEKVIALTFDDGPLPNSTEKVLKILKDNQIKATFFLIGRNVQLHPEVVKKVLLEGHAIGNHSWSHPYNHQTLAGAAREIDKTSEVIAKVIGSKPNLFRPPGGLMHNGLSEYAKYRKMGIAIWSADSQDYIKSHTPQQLLSNIFKQVKPGGIVLMHDGGTRRTNTALALPILIEKLRKQGYRFVTLPELINLDSKSTTVEKLKPSIISKF